YYAGVKYGEFDLDKILESISFKKSERYYIGIKEEGVYAIEQYILAKHHMNAQVYRHRIRGITDQMIIRGIEYAIQEGDKKLKQLFSFKNDDYFIKEYIKWDDFSLMNYLLKSKITKTKEIFDMLSQRKLFKRIYKKSIYDIDDDALKQIKFQRMLQSIDFELLKEKEKKIGNIKSLNCDKDFIIINVVSISNPLYRLPSRMTNDEEIIVISDDKKNKSNHNKTIKLMDIPWSIMGSIAIEDKHQYLEVYALCDPFEIMKNDKYLDRLEKDISEILLN
ncbi:hypothetical protein LLG96_11495, partial [bacterium]|nr:hypothetical protein [bacterium]